MSFLVTRDAKSDQILGRVVTQTTPRLNMMDLKSLDRAARLAPPAISLQDSTAKLTIRFSAQLQAWPFGSDISQWTT
ncbi:MAG: hypothetical protein WBF06_05300 [Candidatus Acidiferrales bacterium]